MWFNIVVTLHVSSQMTGCHKRHITQFTFIRFLFRMDAHMNGHVVRLIECFATQFTLIWLENRKRTKRFLIWFEAENEQQTIDNNLPFHPYAFACVPSNFVAI